MKKILLIGTIALFLVSIATKGNCQYNLVPNPSFEVFDTCPHTYAQIRYCPPWNTPLNTTPDYFNTCDSGFPSGLFIAGVPQNVHGYQWAHSGSGYAGIITYSHNGINPTNYREYIQVPLIDSLMFGVEYFIKFYVSPGDSCRYISNTMGVYFSNENIDTTIFPNYPLPFQPQIINPSFNDLSDRNLWTEISGSFIANGNEKFMLIGNFSNFSNTHNFYTGWGNNASLNYAYYYIDDILLSPLDSITGIESNDLYDKNNPKIFFDNSEIHIFSQDMMYSVSLFNTLGQKIAQMQKINNKNISFETNVANSGVYFVQILFLNREVFNYKFFKP